MGISFQHAQPPVTHAAECDVVQEAPCVSENSTTTTAAAELDMEEMDADPAEAVLAPASSSEYLLCYSRGKYCSEK